MSRACTIPRIATTLARVAARATTTTTTSVRRGAFASSSSSAPSNRLRVVASARLDAGTRRRGSTRGVVAVSRGSWSSAGRSASTTARASAGASAGSVASDLVEYLNDSWTAWHATEAAVEMLESAGYERISETAEWGDLRKNGKYYVTRNASALVAFAVGGAYEPGNGFNVVAAHTDSPCPKLKPVTKIEKGGFKQVGVQTYGGGLWHTWFDRDLSVAGRVLVKRGGALTHELVRIDRPIIRIPTLAIHLDREISTNGFKPNTETNFAPILATAIKGELEGAVSSASGAHHALLLAVLAEELGCAPEDITDFELNVCDTQPSVIGGAAREFIFSGRLDNLASSYCGVRALIEATSDDALAKQTGVQMVALFDNEEVGSSSFYGGASPMMFESIKRAAAALSKSFPNAGGEGLIERTVRNSFLVSADMAHALHPNYMDKHEDNHQPKMHKGMVVKHNANQRYATTAVTAYLFRECAKMENVPTQDFVVRNDMGCGSTIGPIIAAGVGIRTVDVGIPQLSMHSVREMCGTEDIDICFRHFTAFYQNFSAVDATVAVDR
jgi:aspartyl aminopeptidase